MTLRPRNRYIVFDYETQILAGGEKVGGPCVNARKGRHMSPYAGAHAPYLGYQEDTDDHITIVRQLGSTPTSRYLPCFGRDRDLDPDLILVGHNLGFDLHHAFSDVPIDEIPPFTIWDTQTAEYYLEAQKPRARWTKLKNADGSLAERYDVEHGEDGLTKYFDAGIGADKIPIEEVNPYLVADIRVTHDVFIQQFNRACEAGILEFIREMMDAQCAFFLMEKAGMPINLEVADVVETEHKARAEELDVLLHDAWATYFPLMAEAAVDKNGKPKPGTRNPGSNQQLLKVLTSGTYTYKVREQVVELNPDTIQHEPVWQKNGKPKMRMVEKVATVENGGNEDVTEVGEDTLSKLKGVALVDLIIERRKIRKTVDTYVQGYLRKTNSDGMLRTSYNQTATPSGRASSSNPNLQNLQK